MDKDTYKLLKKLYKIDSANIKDLAEDENFQYLLEKKYFVYTNTFIRDEYGDKESEGVKITIEGKSYVEQKRRNFWGFILPYAITTLIAIASLLAQFMK